MSIGFRAKASESFCRVVSCSGIGGSSASWGIAGSNVYIDVSMRDGEAKGGIKVSTGKINDKK